MYNKKQIEDILRDRFILDFEYQKSLNQSDLFSREHIRWECKIVKKEKFPYHSVIFEYQCNKNSNPNLVDCLWCLLMDNYSYNENRNIWDFLYEFGYTKSPEDIRKGIEAYKECQRISHELNCMFSAKELLVLNKIFENY